MGELFKKWILSKGTIDIDRLDRNSNPTQVRREYVSLGSRFENTFVPSLRDRVMIFVTNSHRRSIHGLFNRYSLISGRKLSRYSRLNNTGLARSRDQISYSLPYPLHVHPPPHILFVYKHYYYYNCYYYYCRV